MLTLLLLLLERSAGSYIEHSELLHVPLCLAVHENATEPMLVNGEQCDWKDPERNPEKVAAFLVSTCGCEFHMLAVGEDGVLV